MFSGSSTARPIVARALLLRSRMNASAEARFEDITLPRRHALRSTIEVTLHISDAEVICELEGHTEGRDRHDYAAGALKIGTLALRHAQGRIDADRVRTEGERLMTDLDRALHEHKETIGSQLTASLKEYFDPTSGRFSERVERLIRRDGDLEQTLRRQIGQNDSELAKTLASHVGERSPFLRLLDPTAPDGAVAAMSKAVNDTLGVQRDRILREFSLDNKDGALSRLVCELSDRHTKVGIDLQERIDEVVGEFSLDDETSALSRLVKRVEQAERQISSEFSLDDEGSALARMRHDLLLVLTEQQTASDTFQKQVLQALSAMTARKEEAARSTRHGDAFDAAVFHFIQDRAQSAGDIATQTGATVGLIKNCKVGDCVIELGPDHAAAGATIVVEAKENASYSLADALREMDTARKNRGASIGLFVFSSQIAPVGFQPLARYGNDVVVVWNADDPASDVVLMAGLEITRALCARAKVTRNTQAADFESIERAILHIEKQTGGVEEISRLTGTIKGNSEKILKRAEIMREALQQQVDALRENVEELKQLLESNDVEDQ